MYVYIYLAIVTCMFNVIKIKKVIKKKRKKKQKKRIIVRRTVRSMFGEQTFTQLRTGF